MALNDKNIVITPNIGSSSDDPKIVFTGANSSTTADSVSLYALEDGSLSIEGSAGQLFSVTNSLTGTIFSVNDVSGLPSLEINSSGLVKISEFNGNVLLGTATDDGANKLQVSGGIKVDDITVTGDLIIQGTTTTINTTELNIGDNIITLNSDYTGSTPSENAGIEVERGTLTNASLLWNESSDYWAITSGGTTGRILTTGDEGTGNGLDADTVDGLHSSQFLRSDTNDTTSGNLTISNTSPILILNDDNATTGTEHGGYISYRRQGSEKAWIGYGSSGNDVFSVTATDGNLRLDANGNSVVVSSTSDFVFNSNTQTTHFYITRDQDDPSDEYVRLGVGDAGLDFYINNDETASGITYTFDNTDTETGGGANANTSYIRFDGSNNGARLSVNTTDTAPAHLNVNGTAVISSTTLINGADNNSGKADFAVDTGGNPQISFRDNQVQIGSTDMNWTGRIFDDGIFRIAAWDRNLEISNTGGTTSRDIIFSPSAAGTNTERVRIVGSTGNVGIGTNPSTWDAKLTIRGDDTTPDFTSATVDDISLYVTNSDTDYGTMFGTFGTGKGVLQQRRRATATYYDFSINPYGGNVGIGTDNPSRILTVNGKTLLDVTGSYSAGQSGVVINDSGSATSLNTATTFKVSNNGTSNAYSIAEFEASGGSFVFSNAGRLGIGTTTPERGVDSEGYQARTADIVSGNMTTIAYEFAESRGWGYNTLDDRVFYNGAGSIPFYVDLTRGYFNNKLGIGNENPQNVLDLGNATAGRGIAWGGSTGTNHYNTIYSEYSTASLVLGAGIKGNSSTTDFINPYTGTYGYAAIELDVFADNGIKFYAGPDASRTKDSVLSASERMRIATNGYVGIGTTNPAYQLDVHSPTGAVAMRLRTTSDYQLALESTNSWTGIYFNDGGSNNDPLWHNGTHGTFTLGGGGSNVANKRLHVHGATTIGAGYQSSGMPTNGLAVEGAVGIGITDPVGKFEVHGTNGQLFSVDDSISGTIFAVSDVSGVPSIEVIDDGTVILAEFSGNVGIGITNPAAKLHVVGDVYATGDVTAYYSDERLKNIDSNIESALDKVNTLNGFYYTGNETAKSIGFKKEEREVGVSAQQVEQVLPEAVLDIPGNEEYKTVKYERIVPLLIEAIKELTAQNRELTDRIDKLKNKS